MDVDGKRNEHRPNLDLYFQKAKYLEKDFGQRCRTFATLTSMHGFLEIQTASSIILKAFWTLIICVASGITFYQVYQATSQYVNQSTTTTIEQVKKHDVHYAPIELCVNHWIQWIDWDKAFAHSYTKEAVFYGFSCETNVYSTDRFNLSRAEEQFENAQRINNISTYRDFYLLIAKSVDKFITKIFDKEEEAFVSMPGSDLFKEFYIDEDQLCYKATGDEIKRAMEKPKVFDLSKGNAFRMSLNNSEILSNTLAHLSLVEYANYIYDWLEHGLEHYTLKDNDVATTVPENYLQVGMPLSLYVNGYSDSFIEVLPQVDKYKITIKALVNKWLNKSDKPCATDATYIFPDPTCCVKCAEKIRSDIFGKEALSAENQQSTKNRTCCKGKIAFLNENSSPNDFALQMNENRTGNETIIRKVLGLSCSVDTEDGRVAQFINESVRCEQVCDKLRGCETWRYEMSVDRSSMYSIVEKLADKTWTSLIISYPSDGETLVVVETDKQSWDNFVGNIGGIVGVWTGASILSFIQIFYLCFCATPMSHVP